MLQVVEYAAANARPGEACGFLIGCKGVIVRAVETKNLARQADRFELDAQAHLRLQRELRGRSEAILGIFHSHPTGQPVPSPMDRAMAAYPGWVWLITAFDSKDLCVTRAWRHTKADHFNPLILDVVS